MIIFYLNFARLLSRAIQQLINPAMIFCEKLMQGFVHEFLLSQNVLKFTENRQSCFRNIANRGAIQIDTVKDHLEIE